VWPLLFHLVSGPCPLKCSSKRRQRVSEPELEVIIDAGDLDPSPTETAAKAEAELSEKATAESQKSADAAAAAKAVAQSVAAAAIAAKLTGSDKKREVETAQTEPSQAPVDDAIEATPDSVEDIVPDVDITSATDAVETVETVRDPIVETVGEADIDQVIETAQDVSEDAEIEMPVDADDISTQLETAIKEER